MPFKNFVKEVNSWWTFDGGDYCPECWSKFLESLPASVRDGARLDARLLASADIAETRRCRDGYYVTCEICFTDVSIPL